MKKSLPVSDEILNAFVDDEIDAEERECIFEMEATDQDIAQAICEIRKLKELVNAAKAKEPETVKFPHHLALSKRYGNKLFYMATSLVFVLALVIFSVTYQEEPNIDFALESTYFDRVALLDAVRKEHNLNLVLHLKSPEFEQAAELLQVLESVLKVSANYKNNLQVEVIVSGPGLYLLQKGTSVYNNKINSIWSNYNNVTFMACGQTLQRHRKRTNKNIQIISKAMLVDSGPKWVKLRQRQGWAYLLI